ncbi:MAG: NADH-quinone oxidoreductase subunit I [FCB group bacterium]|nr:NADH-quinone oxidoreductase subunit I [FCB group bacterium]
MGVLKDIKELVRGLGITGKHLGRHAVTIQYPEERWTIPERSRGVVVLLSDKETGELNCTACMLCMRACPTAAIFIDAPRDENKKKHLKEFRVDHGICCFCGLCEEACNFSAIKLATKYEFSTFNKEDTLWDIKKLQEIGRDVPYVDTRKKKPVKKAVEPKAAPPSAETTNEAKSQPDTPAVDEKKLDTKNDMESSTPPPQTDEKDDNDKNEGKS